MSVRQLPPREKARMSVNSLTEYCHTNASRRRQIVKEQKAPDVFRVNYYEYARNTIVAYLLSGRVNKDLLPVTISRLHQIEPESAYEATRIFSNTEALECFYRMAQDIDVCGLSLVRSGIPFPKLLISDVDVSVWPDLTLHGQLPRHGKVFGGIILMFSKRDEMRLDEEMAKTPTSLLMEALSRTTGDRKVVPQSCILVDVFGQQVFTAPKSYRSIMKTVTAACSEVKLLWENTQV